MLQIPAQADPADMDTTSFYCSLTPEQQRFDRTLSNYPLFYSYWDFNTRDCDIQGLTAAMEFMSPGEQAMGKFFLSIWLHDDTQSIGVVHAAELVDNNRQVIADWLVAPYFP